MATTKGKPGGPVTPTALTDMQVDVTTRMGALTAATPTGLQILDRVLSGGLRTGTMMAISGAPGVGRTAFSLMLSYMAARAKAAVVFTSASLDETEVMARLAARALHREYPESKTPYGAIWSGQAWQDDATRRPVGAAVETVVKKVGTHFTLYNADPFTSTERLAECAAHLWTRHDRVILVVDDIEAFSAGLDGNRGAEANMSFENRIAQVAFELRRICDQGCAVVATVLERNADFVSPACTLAAALRNKETSAAPMTERMLALGARPLDLVITKNRLGPTGIVPLRFIPGAATFEERAP
jgi:archaellum biogenesis ATPase FlaH